MSNVIELNKTRQLTEPEFRGVGTLMLTTLELVQVQIATWLVSKRRPSHDEMIALVKRIDFTVNSIAELSNEPPTDGHRLDDDIAHLEERIRKLRERSNVT